MIRAGLPLAILLLAAAARADPAADAVARGDAAWARRAEGASADGRAAPGPIGDAITAYEAAIAAAPEALGPRWRLVRALYFAGEYASPDEAASRARFERATKEAEAAHEVLGRRAGGRARLDALAPGAVRQGLPPEIAGDATALAFWSAIAWGGWAQRNGLLGAVREGVANRIHRGVLVTIALDPNFEEGGAHRLLARLHATLPRVPLFSGWVDRDAALPEMERALRVAPDHPGSRVLLALTLLDVAPGRRGEAIALLEAAAIAEPRASDRVEDLAIRRTARERLASELDARSE